MDYTWDANGNLLNDGANTYAYDSANRLAAVNGPSSTVQFAYNGLGDRMQQTVNGQTTTYSLDLDAGLTQVLSDGNNTYLYGLGRIAQLDTGILDTEYFLGDALGSVRQLADESGEVTLAKDYEPYGEVLTSAGGDASAYGYTGEYTDSTGMVYLRARYYAPWQGRFMTRDKWDGNDLLPLSFNKWNYVMSNPINSKDPTGYFPDFCQQMPTKGLYELCVLTYYGYEAIDYFTMGSNITGQQGCYSGEIEYRAPGYLEGNSLFMVFIWAGRERVYDFATMQSGTFDYWGPGGSDNIAGTGISTYGGLVFGFRSDRGISKDYSGPFLLGQFGVSVDIGIGIGVGISSFFAPGDFLIRGATWYVGGTLSADMLQIIDAGGAYLFYEPVGRAKSYLLPDGTVNKSELVLDIATGYRSPWLTNNGGLGNATRALGSLLALKYAYAYEDIRNAP